MDLRLLPLLPRIAQLMHPRERQVATVIDGGLGSKVVGKRNLGIHVCYGFFMLFSTNHVSRVSQNPERRKEPRIQMRSGAIFMMKQSSGAIGE